MFRYHASLALAVSLGLIALTAADDKNSDKKSKIPPLTFIKNVELAEISYVDEGSERIGIKTKEIVQQWVPLPSPPGRYMPNRGQYVPKEQIKEHHLNLSPDVKIRLMNTKTDPKKSDKRGAKTANKGAKGGVAKGDAASGDDEKAGEKGKEEGEKEKDYDAKLGGALGKKSNLAKGQLVRLALGQNNDRVNPQIYVMVVYVLSEGK